MTGPLPLTEYGSLFLDTPPTTVDVEVVPSIQLKPSEPSSTVDYNLTVRNDGTGGADTFDINVTSGWTVTVLDASGTLVLTDTDGDTIPDTGSVPAGGFVDIVVRVDVPPLASGYNVAFLTFTSSVDILVSADAEVHTTIPTAWFDPPHLDYGLDTDFPLDGLYNMLVVEAYVNTTTSDWYELQASLYNSNGTVLIETIYEGAWISQFNRTVYLEFNGNAIRKSGIDGPYLVEMDLFAFNFTHQDSDTHTTGAYLRTEFQPPGAQFEPPHSDYGWDVDMPPDGFFDYLVVQVGVNVTKEGWYYVGGYLMNDNRTVFITTGQDSYYLPVGMNSVDVSFGGPDIRFSGIDGPYIADLELRDDWWNLLDNLTYLTGPYNHTEFQPPGAMFEPPHSDYGIDTSIPPNGFYDYLVISASINVSKADFYEVDALLTDQNGTQFIGMGIGADSLVPGLNSIDIQFDGRDIYDSGVDGPYRAELLLFDSLWNLLDMDTHTTNSYNYTDFEPPGAKFEPPHSDYGLDTDIPPNGYYNQLVINASVNVTTAGFYQLEIGLYDQTGMWWISWGNSYQWLDVGLNSVPVMISGRDIYDSGFDGPYLAEMVLYEDNWTFA
ncbi:MAG: hypothetical protein KAW09_11795, partial [Thermoplasmata archaeon]|nr:hypothetical protein [Thermoplasmata archaeon]